MEYELTQHNHTLYRFFSSEGELLYVGMTHNIMARWVEHKREKDWYTEIAYGTTEHFPDRAQLKAAELQAIRSESPKHNKTGVPRNKNRVKDLDGPAPKTIGVKRPGANFFPNDANYFQQPGEDPKPEPQMRTRPRCRLTLPCPSCLATTMYREEQPAGDLAQCDTCRTCWTYQEYLELNSLIFRPKGAA